ncbi:two component transcriptional regulator, LuxR family [Quadrisphaera granulorum]|uniref:LuxR family two component transcriptional regulator n=1 Tax=Quadrisphaera granulorum TaxID=317664 RepID=A0A315ZXA5_9ACTN|nr:response regulator transcription factor [Quadrisphaera granulorum]PWJ49872.1 LuxR family two component transcriptional regulator [Quadrisphaera granulorum]SZE98080.1 two component transcriptional regulator, LuxR family [Quadrisphaera granulorum]
MSHVRVLLADDHPFYREGVRAMLASEDHGIRLVAEAATGEEAVALAAREAPDVVLMDLTMPGIGGLEATRRIVTRQPATAVLVLTMHDDASVFLALRAGARGYLLKHAGVEELTRAIVSVAKGEAIFSPAAARRLTEHFVRVPGRTHAPDAFPDLTGRERQVLALLASDLGTVDIARRLGLTEKTVYNYVATVLAKLRVRDREEAAARAREAGLGELP